MLRVGGVAVAPLDEVGHLLAHAGVAARVGVCTDGAAKHLQEGSNTNKIFDDSTRGERAEQTSHRVAHAAGPCSPCLADSPTASNTVPSRLLDNRALQQALHSGHNQSRTQLAHLVQLAGALDDVLGVQGGHGGVVQQEGGHHQGGHLRRGRWAGGRATVGTGTPVHAGKTCACAAPL